MRILQVGKFFPPPFGGVESVCLTMHEELNKVARADIVVANHAPSLEVSEHFGGKVVKLPSYGTLLSQPLVPSLFPWLRRELRGGSYDLVHLHLPNPLADLALQASGTSLPIVLTWHADVLGKQAVARVYQPIADRMVARAAAIVAATPKHFPSMGQLDQRHADKFACVPFGFDASRMDATPETLRRAAELRAKWAGDVVVLAVGRHVPYKGFEYLVRAARELPESMRVVIVGDGPLRESLMALARELGVDARVVFPGAIPGSELKAAFHACDIFCLPSVTRAEAFGVATAEAMMCAKPAVCCELGNGVNYLNRDDVTSLVVPPRDPAALAAMLRRLAADPALRARLGTAGQRMIREEYSLEAMRTRLMDVYRTVLARGRWTGGPTASAPGACS
jgi:glycosyltransferase involved in cell wall biosynthesis